MKGKYENEPKEISLAEEGSISNPGNFNNQGSYNYFSQQICQTPIQPIKNIKEELNSNETESCEFEEDTKSPEKPKALLIEGPLITPPRRLETHETINFTEEADIHIPYPPPTFNMNNITTSKLEKLEPKRLPTIQDFPLEITISPQIPLTEKLEDVKKKYEKIKETVFKSRSISNKLRYKPKIMATPKNDKKFVQIEDLSLFIKYMEFRTKPYCSENFSIEKCKEITKSLQNIIVFFSNKNY